MGYVEALRAIWLLILDDRWSDLQVFGMSEATHKKSVIAFLNSRGGVEKPPDGPVLFASMFEVEGLLDAATRLLDLYKEKQNGVSLNKRSKRRRSTEDTTEVSGSGGERRGND